MRIALIAPPFIPVPPRAYGGTELFVAHLAEGLRQHGIDVVVYANGESTVDVELKSLYPQSQWPLQGEILSNMRDMNHTTWAVADAAIDCDIIHLNSVPGLATSRFVELPFVHTIHHPHVAELSDFYSCFPDVQYVAISEFQRSLESMPKIQTIHHGIRMDRYAFKAKKEHFVSFVGRFAPVKGPHLAIAASKKAGIPLRLAGEVQPLYQNYFEKEIKPHIDGKFIEYVGEADLAAKTELLGNSMAMLFPVQWNEPFGLAMIEAMACGTPVIALPGGSVQEVVRDGVSGYVCENVDQMVERLRHLALAPAIVREYAEENFSVDIMVSKHLALYRSMLAERDAIVPISAEVIAPTDEPGVAAA